MNQSMSIIANLLTSAEGKERITQAFGDLIYASIYKQINHLSSLLNNLLCLYESFYVFLSSLEVLSRL